MKLFFKEVEEISERDEEAVDLLRRRLLGGVAVILPFFPIIISRLWSLQILHGDDYKQHAYSNRVRVQEIAAPRGHILDRKGREIVTNRPSFNVVLMREDSHNIEDVLKRLAPVLKEDISVLWERVSIVPLTLSTRRSDRWRPEFWSRPGNSRSWESHPRKRSNLWKVWRSRQGFSRRPSWRSFPSRRKEATCSRKKEPNVTWRNKIRMENKKSGKSPAIRSICLIG